MQIASLSLGRRCLLRHPTMLHLFVSSSEASHLATSVLLRGACSKCPSTPALLETSLTWNSTRPFWFFWHLSRSDSELFTFFSSFFSPNFSLFGGIPSLSTFMWKATPPLYAHTSWTCGIYAFLPNTLVGRCWNKSLQRSWNTICSQFQKDQLLESGALL